jgi:outer membrane receptor protein involved in Fe transport
VEYVGARKTPKDTTAPGYWLTNLTLSRPVAGPHRWGFVAGVRNLFDQKYFDPADQEARADLFPLPGRALFFRLLFRSRH